MSQRERHILGRAIRTVSDEAAKVDGVVDEALAAGLGGDHPLTVHVKMLRQELLMARRVLRLLLAANVTPPVIAKAHVVAAILGT